MAHPLKTYRAAHDLTQGAVAARLGISVSKLSRMERHRLTITAEEAVKIEAITDKAVRRHELRPDLWEPQQ